MNGTNSNFYLDFFRSQYNLKSSHELKTFSTHIVTITYQYEKSKLEHPMSLIKKKEQNFTHEIDQMSLQSDTTREREGERMAESRENLRWKAINDHIWHSNSSSSNTILPSDFKLIFRWHSLKSVLYLLHLLIVMLCKKKEEEKEEKKAILWIAAAAAKQSWATVFKCIVYFICAKASEPANWERQRCVSVSNELALWVHKP